MCMGAGDAVGQASVWRCHLRWKYVPDKCQLLLVWAPLQTLHALQQQEHDLALLQQQLSTVPRANAFQRSRTCDLDHTMPTQAAALAAVQQQQQYGQMHQPAPLDYEQQLLALQAAHPGLSMPTAGPLGNARARSLMNAPPQRSFSSEALRIGGRGQQAGAGSSSAAQFGAGTSSNRLVVVVRQQCGMSARFCGLGQHARSCCLLGWHACSLAVCLGRLPATRLFTCIEAEPLRRPVREPVGLHAA
jgi:hypothetical protein